MEYRVSNAYRTLIGRAIAGETVNLTPAVGSIGNGAWDGQATSINAPRESMYALVASVPVSELERDGQAVRCEIRISGNSNPITVNEVALFTSDGVLILHATFANRTFADDTDFVFPIALNPATGGIA